MGVCASNSNVAVHASDPSPAPMEQEQQPLPNDDCTNDKNTPEQGNETPQSDSHDDEAVHVDAYGDAYAQLGTYNDSSSSDDDEDEEEDDEEAKPVVPVIVARLSVAGVLAAVPEQRGDEELAVLMGVDLKQLKHDFNGEVQPLLEKPAPTPHEQRERGEELEKVVRAYNEVAERVGRFVVEMVRQEPATWVLKPLGKGLAGGLKFIVGKLLVKVPLAAGKAAQLFKGDQLLLHKAGGCELRALNALMEHNVPGVHTPLDVAVEVCGLEAHVMALLPIDGEDSLKVGSADASRTLQCATEGVAADAAHKVGMVLHLKPHRVREESTGEAKVMHLAGDVEVHESAEDGRAYLLDVGRLLPPTNAFMNGVPLPFVHQFRPEFMASLPVELPTGRSLGALSPDGFCGWGKLDHQEHNSELRAAWQVVLRRSVDVARGGAGGRSAEELATLLQPPADNSKKRPLAAAFHAQGVNMRTLLVARAGLSDGDNAAARLVLLLECAFRAVKHIARRRLLQVSPLTGETVHEMMSTLEEELQDEGMWRGELCRVVRQLFVSHIPKVPATVREQFAADKAGLADDMVAALGRVRDEESPLGRAFVASVRAGVAGVRRGEDGQWDATASVTRVRLPAYGSVAAALRRLEVEIEARKQTKGEQSLEVLNLQKEMLDVLENFVEKDAASTRAKAEKVIAEIEASVGDEPDVERMFAVRAAGDFWSHAGEFDKALEMFERARRVYEEAYGEDDVNVGGMCTCIAVVYESKGNLDKALELYERDLVISKRVHGDEDPRVGETLSNIADVYGQKDDPAKALELYEHALEIISNAVGADHPRVASVLNNMAITHQQLGDYRKALELFQRTLDIKKAAYGSEHPQLAQTVHNIAIVYGKVGNGTKALEVYEHALRIREAAFGPDHPSVGDTVNNMAIVHRQMGNYDQALTLLDRALRIAQAAFGPENLHVAQTLNSIAVVYQLQGEHGKALQYYERTMKIRQVALGPEHPKVGDTLNNMAIMNQQLGNNEQALQLYERVLAIRQPAVGADHVTVATVLANMVDPLIATGEAAQAKTHAERALAIFQSSLPDDHPHVAFAQAALQRAVDATE